MRASHGPVDTWLQHQIGKVVIGLGIDNFRWARWLAVLGHGITAGAVVLLVSMVSMTTGILYSILGLGLTFSLLSDLHLITELTKANHRMSDEGQFSVEDVKLLYQAIRIRKGDLGFVSLYVLCSGIGISSLHVAWLVVGFGFLVQAIALHLATSWDSGRTWRERIKEKLSSIQFLPSLKPAVA